MSKTSQLRHKAQVLLKKGKLNEAIEEYKRLLSVESKNPNLYNELGDIFLRTGDRIQAISCFEKAAAHYEQVALYNNAVAVCKKILRVVPNRIDTIFKLGELRSKQKFDGEATNYFSQYLTCVLSDPQSAPEGVHDKVEHIVELAPVDEIISSASDVYSHVGLHFKSAELLAKLIVQGGENGDPSKLALFKNRFDMIKSKLTSEELQELEDKIEREGGAEARESVKEANDESEIIEAIDPGAQPSGESFEPMPGDACEPDVEGTGEAAAAASAVEEMITGAQNTEEVIEQGMDEPEPEQEPQTGEPPEYQEEATAREETTSASPDTIADEQEPPPGDAISTGDDIASALEEEEVSDTGTLPDGMTESAEAFESAQTSAVEAEDAGIPAEDVTVGDRLADEITSDIEEDDFKSHYDLGMAYIEMALLDEAVKELQIAARSGQLKLKSLEMIGHCFLQQSKPRLAVKQLNRGLDMSVGDGAECLGIHYNLGLSYEMLGDMEKAREHFEEVYIIDVTFRDIAEKMQKFSTSS